MFDEERPYEVIPDDTSPQQREIAWTIGAGLQKIDGLEPTSYATKLAREYISGKATYNQIHDAVEKHYEGKTTNNPQSEADISAIRIMRIVQQNGFSLSPAYLAAIHGQIFEGLLPEKSWVGRFRKENLSKKEPVLGGETIDYSDYSLIRRTLDYDFDQETERPVPKTPEAKIQSALEFVSGIWQIHPFREGNTRTTACFLIAYLRSMGVIIDNKPFELNSEYFRDALVLANAPRRYGKPDNGPLLEFGKALLDRTKTLKPLRPTN